MREYRFLTTWLLDCERERVWDAVYDSERWPEWWRGVRVAERLAPGDERGIGQVGRYVWRSAIPYAVEFEIVSTRVEPPHLLEGRASGGLEGVGRWRLFDEDGTTALPGGQTRFRDGVAHPITAVLYEWNVGTTRRWMNLVGPVARPVFQWNHDWVMRRGGEGLAELLGCRLLAQD